jgi:hypothetical protein
MAYMRRDGRQSSGNARHVGMMQCSPAWMAAGRLPMTGVTADMCCPACFDCWCSQPKASVNYCRICCGALLCLSLSAGDTTAAYACCGPFGAATLA